MKLLPKTQDGVKEQIRIVKLYLFFFSIFAYDLRAIKGRLLYTTGAVLVVAEVRVEVKSQVWEKGENRMSNLMAFIGMVVAYYLLGALGIVAYAHSVLRIPAEYAFFAAVAFGGAGSSVFNWFVSHLK